MARVGNRVLGVDISPNHAGFVLLSDGEPTHYRYVAERQAVAKKSKALGAYVDFSKVKDLHERGCRRVAFWWDYLQRVLVDCEPEYVGIEDYAYGAGRNAHQIGEVGGLLRLLAWRRGVRLRLHDPSSLKMFVAHDGTADKREVAHFAKERWHDCRTFERFSYDTPKGRHTTTEEDLCEAFALAELVWLEVRLRDGRARLGDLHPKEVQVFNRVTHRWQSNLLDRDWLQRRDAL